jgi:hypothetical protein
MATLSYTPPNPQDDDSELVIDHKTAVNVSRTADAAEAIAAAIGSAEDAPNDPTLIGLLKQIAINTTPTP